RDRQQHDRRERHARGAPHPLMIAPAQVGGGEAAFSRRRRASDRRVPLSSTRNPPAKITIGSQPIRASRAGALGVSAAAPKMLAISARTAGASLPLASSAWTAPRILAALAQLHSSIGSLS